MGKKITVLIVDDSALARQILSDMISADAELEVAGIARDGVEAVRLTRDLKPDVVTMDIHMPEMDGLSALEYIMKAYPRPVVMVSALVKKGAAPTLKSLELGAVDFIAKPNEYPTSIADVRDDVIRKIKAAAGSRAKEIWSRSKRASGPPTRLSVDTSSVRGGRMVVIGASAGGPRALSAIIPALPADLPASVVIVQHMPEPFTSSFATRLDSRSGLKVREAAQNEEVLEGQALVVPGARDLEFEAATGRIRVRLTPTVARHGASPVIDVTMESAARIYGDRCVGVILSGMGSDGAMGLGMIKDAGGETLAQSEETCLVYGMPRAAVEKRFADEVVPLERIAAAIIRRI